MTATFQSALASEHALRHTAPVPDVPLVSVVIPTLNEAENLPLVLPRVPRYVHEVIIVDGLSTDGTIEVARAHYPSVKVVLHDQRGKGAALRRGFAASTGDIIVMLDADGSTDPRDIPAYVGLLVAGADVVVGSRFVQGGGTADMEPHRKMGNWVLTRVVRLAFGGRYSDLCYGFTAFWREHVPLFGCDFDGFEAETAIHVRALRAGLHVAEVPSFEHPRVHGASNLNAVRDGFRILVWLGREWRAGIRRRRSAGLPGR